MLNDENAKLNVSLDSTIIEIIGAIAERNPKFLDVDFRKEFKGLMDRDPTIEERTFFLSERQRVRDCSSSSVPTPTNSPHNQPHVPSTVLFTTPSFSPSVQAQVETLEPTQMEDLSIQTPANFTPVWGWWSRRKYLTISAFGCVLLGMFALIITLILNKGVKSPFNWTSDLILIAVIIYIATGVFVLFCICCFPTSDCDAQLAELVYVITTFLAILVMVAAVMHLAQMKYTDAVFKLYFDDIVHSPTYEQNPLDTPEAIEAVGKKGGRYVASAVLLMLEFFRIFGHFLLHARVLGKQRARLDQQPLSVAVCTAVPVGHSPLLVHIIGGACAVRCVHPLFHIRRGRLTPRCMACWVVVLLLLLVVAGTLDFVLPQTYRPKQSIDCEPSFFYICPKETRFFSSSSSSSRLSLFHSRSGQQLNLDASLNLSASVSAQAPGNIHRSRKGRAERLKYSAALTNLPRTYADTDADIGTDTGRTDTDTDTGTDDDPDTDNDTTDEEAPASNVATAEDCARFGRSVARYVAVMKNVQPRVEHPGDGSSSSNNSDRDSPRCYDYADKVQEWVDELGQGAINVFAASLALSSGIGLAMLFPAACVFGFLK